MFGKLPNELEVLLTPGEFAELCAYLMVKADAIDAAKAKAGAPATGPQKKAKMGTQRRQPT